MRHPIISRLALISGLCLVLMGSQFSCSSGGDEDGGNGGPTGFDVELVLKTTGGTPRTNFDVGQSIVFELHVTNRSGSTQTLNLPSGQVYDLVLLDDNGTAPRWRWSFNRTFTPAASTLTFAGHQEQIYVYIWNGILDNGTQLMSGTYQVRGTLAYPQFDSDWRGNNALAAPLRTITISN